MSRRALVLVPFAVVAFAASPARAQENPFGDCKRMEPIQMSQGRDTVSILDRPGAVRYIFKGTREMPVRIVCDDVTLQAIEIAFDSDTRAITATGDVSLHQPMLRLSASRANIDGNTKLGVFYDAAGQAQIGEQPAQKDPFGTIEPDVVFWGERLEKKSDKRFTLERGGFTTCVQPSPRWAMGASKLDIALDDHVFMKNTVLRVKDVPLAYLPVFYYPMEKDGRSTGFLIPIYGASDARGTALTNAFFWAISRSQDATFSHDWTTKAGQGGKGEYRFMRSPDTRGQFSVHMSGSPEITTADGLVTTPGKRSLNIVGDANQWLPGGFRLNTNVNYFTNVATQQLYQSAFDTNQQTRSYSASLTGGIKRMRIDASFYENDTFQGGTEFRSGRLPSVRLSYPDRPIGRSKVYFGSSAETIYFLSQSRPEDPTDVTVPGVDQSMWRMSSDARVRVPLSSLSFLAVTVDASWRFTHWFESLVPDPLGGEDATIQAPVGLTRQLFDVAARVTGPTFSRVFRTEGNKYADAFKHLIEPTFTLVRTTPFNDFRRVVVIDRSGDGLSPDYRVDFGINNKVLARRPAPPGPPGSPPRPGVTRQILLVSVRQSYYSDISAIQFDPQYQVKSARSPFSAMVVSATATPADSLTSQFDMYIDAKTRAVTTLNANGGLNLPRVGVNAFWSNSRQLANVPGFEKGRQSLGGYTTLRSRRNTVGGTYRFQIDVTNKNFLSQRILTYYNTQCCGVNFDWQTSAFNYGALKQNRQFSVSFTLAGIGSFSNPMGSFGGPGQ